MVYVQREKEGEMTEVGIPVASFRLPNWLLSGTMVTMSIKEVSP